MALFDADDGLKVHREGQNARAIVGGREYLFGDSDPADIIAIYARCGAQARQYFEGRWRSAQGVNLDAADFGRLTQEATLHWMYYYIVNHLPVQITDGDWDHPQSWRIIQRVVAERFGPDSEESIGLCAQLMGLSRHGFLDWKRGDELYLNR